MFFRVVKASTTRVGAGSFPNELCDAWGIKLQTIGREFGTTTGLTRRIGSLGLKLLQYSVGVNSYTAINLTKFDILDSHETNSWNTSSPLLHLMNPSPALLENFKLNNTDFPIIRFSRNQGSCQYWHSETKEIINGFPADLEILQNIEVEYVTLRGWQEPIGQCRSFNDLPPACREYVEYIEKFLHISIKYIGVGAKERGYDCEITVFPVFPPNLSSGRGSFV